VEHQSVKSLGNDIDVNYNSADNNCGAEQVTRSFCKRVLHLSYVYIIGTLVDLQAHSSVITAVPARK